MQAKVIDLWHEIVRTGDVSGLKSLLAADVVFHSPVVHMPQQGRAITLAYLAAALSVLGQPSFRYVREVVADHEAVLEFMLELDGIEVNGVDIIRWNDRDEIVEFKVMIRPLKAINRVHEMMGAELQKMRPAG